MHCRVRKPYAWYLRLPDLAGLRHIAPAIEDQLSHVHYAGHTGELKISFYRSGLLLGPGTGAPGQDRSLAEPQGHSTIPLSRGAPFCSCCLATFFRRVELRFPDCWWDNDLTFGLLNALFRSKFGYLACS
jgi:hypothetical protein